jgi:protein-S-isoprenylcysteine O-methyltransferase Ste14
MVAMLAVVIAWICWGILVAVWVAGALYNAGHSPTALTRGRFWFVSVAVAWLVLRLLPRRDTRFLLVHGTGLRLAGIAALLAATAFTVWARLTLGRMWSAAPLVRQEHELRTNGPYAVTRHPIYTGLLAMLAGTALLSGLGPWAVLFVVAVVGLEFKLREEERLMAGEFGTAYEEYRRRVPQLVPGLYLAVGHRHR